VDLCGFKGKTDGGTPANVENGGNFDGPTKRRT
jgi:hypothetical protein